MYALGQCHACVDGGEASTLLLGVSCVIEVQTPWLLLC
jgi:hypothetical protein